VHTPEGSTLVAPQLNYVTNTILKLKAKIAKIKTKVMEIQNNYL